jgi:hypothetical protein
VLPRQSPSVAQYFPTPIEFPGAPVGTHPPESPPAPASPVVPLSEVVPPESDPVPPPSVVPVPVPVPPVLLELLQATAHDLFLHGVAINPRRPRGKRGMEKPR